MGDVMMSIEGVRRALIAMLVKVVMLGVTVSRMC